MACDHDPDTFRVLGEHEQVPGEGPAIATLNEEGDVTVDAVCECGAHVTLQIFAQTILDNADEVTVHDG